MSELDIKTFNTFFADICELDADGRQKLVAALPEFLPDLRRESLEDVKEAVRNLLKGKPPYGVAAKLGRVFGICAELRTEKDAGKAKVAEYLYTPSEEYMREKATIREILPAWDALSDSDRAFRLKMAGKALGYEQVRDKWQDQSGGHIPASWVQRRAQLAFAAELQTEAV
jgi:hypothetical protein